MKLKIYGKHSVFNRINYLKNDYCYFNGIAKYDKHTENYVYKYLELSKVEFEKLFQSFRANGINFLFSFGGELDFHQHSFSEPYSIRIRFMEFPSKKIVKESISNVYGTNF